MLHAIARIKRFPYLCNQIKSCNEYEKNHPEEYEQFVKLIGQMANLFLYRKLTVTNL